MAAQAARQFCPRVEVVPAVPVAPVVRVEMAPRAPTESSQRRAPWTAAVVVTAPMAVKAERAERAEQAREHSAAQVMAATVAARERLAMAVTEVQVVATVVTAVPREHQALAGLRG